MTMVMCNLDAKLENFITFSTVNVICVKLFQIDRNGNAKIKSSRDLCAQLHTLSFCAAIPTLLYCCLSLAINLFFCDYEVIMM